jgi:TRAP transporter TAXI family solute receptor
MSGVYFPIASSITHILNKTNKYKATLLPTPGSVHNLHLLLKGDAELALVQSDTLMQAFEAQGEFAAGYPNTQNLRALASLYTEYVHVLVHRRCLLTKGAAAKEAEPELSKDLLTRCTFNYGPLGSGTHEHARMIVSALGAPSPTTLSAEPFSEATEYIMEGKLDGGFFTLGKESISLIPLMRSGDFRLLSLPPWLIASLRKSAPHIHEGKLPPGTYPHQPYALSTLSVSAIVATSTQRLSDPAAQELIRMFLDDIQSIRAAHACGKEFSLQTALDGIPIPVHAGAKQFYVQHGVLSPLLR